MSTRHRAILFANGDFDLADIAVAAPRATDLLVCVDGGLAHCVAAGFVPDIVIGDMDSVDADISATVMDSNPETIVFPVAKNASDLELTLELMADRKISDVVVVGISGGRTDHMLFNWQLLSLRQWPFGLRFIDRQVDAVVVHKNRPGSFDLEADTLISLLPSGSNVTGVVLTGVCYPLDNADISVGSTLGLSNVVCYKPVRISVASGTVVFLIVRNR